MNEQSIPRDAAAAAAELRGRVLPYDAPGFRASIGADPQGAALTVGQPTVGS